MKWSRSIALFAVLAASQTFAADQVAAMMNAGRIDEAIRTLSAQLSQNPQSAETLFDLCRAYYVMEDYDNAISNCERATGLAPNVAKYHLWLGRAYGDKADHSGPFTGYSLAKKVAAQFEQAVNLEPKNVQARSDLAEFYGSAPGIVGGGADKARRVAQETVSLDPVAAANMRAQIALAAKDYPTSEREAQQAIQLSGGSARTQLELARIYGKQKRWPEMESTIQKALASAKKKPDDLFFAGELLVGNGRNYSGAIEILRSYLSGPTDEQSPAFRAYYLMGKAYEKLGDRAAAAKAYRSALDLASNYRRAQDALKHLG